MFELINSNNTPPCGWTYKIPETGLSVEGDCLDSLIASVKANLDLNNIDYDSALLLPKIVEDICRRSPTGICKNFVNRFIARSREVQNGTIALSQMIRRGKGAFVSVEEAQRRSEVCVECHYNIKNPGCSTCKGFRMVIGASKGSRTTTNDEKLNTCGICRCFIETLVHVDADVLRATTDKRQVNEYPEWCWKMKAIKGDS